MNNMNIQDTLKFILNLQKNICCDEEQSCTRPFLGPNSNVCYNTRPITLFTCCTGTNWSMPYEIDGEANTSAVFRIENIDGNCATFRVLVPTTTETGTTYALSNSFFTIDLSCVLAMQCLPDIYAN